MSNALLCVCWHVCLRSSSHTRGVHTVPRPQSKHLYTMHTTHFAVCISSLCTHTYVHIPLHEICLLFERRGFGSESRRCQHPSIFLFFLTSSSLVFQGECRTSAFFKQVVHVFVEDFSWSFSCSDKMSPDDDDDGEEVVLGASVEVSAFKHDSS